MAQGQKGRTAGRAGGAGAARATLSHVDARGRVKMVDVGDNR